MKIQFKKTAYEFGKDAGFNKSFGFATSLYAMPIVAA